MKKRILLWLLVSKAITLFTVGCWNHSTSEFCPDKFKTEAYGEASLSYCNDYAVAVSRFLREPDEIVIREERKIRFEIFLDELVDCNTIDCIVQAVDSSSLVPAFNSFFDEEHIYAQQRATKVDADKVGLILCGFEQGLKVNLYEGGM